MAFITGPVGLCGATGRKRVCAMPGDLLGLEHAAEVADVGLQDVGGALLDQLAEALGLE